MPKKSRARADGPAARAVLLDQVIHERVRLGIVCALASHDSLTFAELRALLGTTDGNLGLHARRLELARYIGCDKRFAGRVPRTEYRLTAKGRRALERYLTELEAVLAGVTRADAPSAVREP